MSSDSSFNIHNALYLVKYPSRAAQNSPEGRGLRTPSLHEHDRRDRAVLTSESWLASSDLQMRVDSYETEEKLSSGTVAFFSSIIEKTDENIGAAEWGWKRGLMDVKSESVTWLRVKLVCCFKLAANVVWAGIWQFVYDYQTSNLGRVSVGTVCAWQLADLDSILWWWNGVHSYGQRRNSSPALPPLHLWFSVSLICSTGDEGYSVPENSIFLSFHYYLCLAMLICSPTMPVSCLR